MAIVTGDDVLDLQPRFRAWGGKAAADLPALMSANAYLGAAPVAQALAAGAGLSWSRGRCVDNASLLGIAIHEVRLAHDGLRPARGRPASQAIWWNAARRPQAACSPTGSRCPTGPTSATRWCGCRPTASRLSQPRGRGLGWSRGERWATAAVRISGDPAACRLPDVVCDFTQVAITDAWTEGAYACRGARGRARQPPQGHGHLPAERRIAIMMAIRGQRAL